MLFRRTTALAASPEAAPVPESATESATASVTGPADGGKPSAAAEAGADQCRCDQAAAVTVCTHTDPPRLVRARASSHRQEDEVVDQLGLVAATVVCDDPDLAAELVALASIAQVLGESLAVVLGTLDPDARPVNAAPSLPPADQVLVSAAIDVMYGDGDSSWADVEHALWAREDRHWMFGQHASTRPTVADLVGEEAEPHLNDATRSVLTQLLAAYASVSERTLALRTRAEGVLTAAGCDDDARRAAHVRTAQVPREVADRIEAATTQLSATTLLTGSRR